MIFCSHTIYSVLPIIILAIWNEFAGLLFKVEPAFRNLVPDCKSCPVKCWEGLGKDSCASVSLQRLTVCKVTVIYHNIIELYYVILFHSEKEGMGRDICASVSLQRFTVVGKLAGNSQFAVPRHTTYTKPEANTYTTQRNNTECMK